MAEVDTVDGLTSGMESINIIGGTGAVLAIERLDSFTFGQDIGSGSFGKVMKARHPTYNDVAIKMLFPNCGEEAIREATKMRKLCVYPSIVNVICLAIDGQKLGIVMEWMRLGSLRSFQQRVKHIPWALRMRMLKDISEGMFFLHHHQNPSIVHGDLKAENIFVNENLVVKIGDLGLSRTMKSMMDRPKGGTPTHMPPEYFTIKSSPNTKWDVYSFAILQYEIGSGEEVYKELDGDAFRLELLVKTRKKRLPIEDLPDDTPSVVKELIEKCWEHEPDERPDFEHIKTRVQKEYNENFHTSIHEALKVCQQQLSQEEKNTTELDQSKNLTTANPMFGIDNDKQANSSRENANINQNNYKTPEFGTKRILGESYGEETVLKTNRSLLTTVPGSQRVNMNEYGSEMRHSDFQETAGACGLESTVSESVPQISERCSLEKIAVSCTDVSSVHRNMTSGTATTSSATPFARNHQDFIEPPTAQPLQSVPPNSDFYASSQFPINTFSDLSQYQAKNPPQLMTSSYGDSSSHQALYTDNRVNFTGQPIQNPHYFDNKHHQGVGIHAQTAQPRPPPIILINSTRPIDFDVIRCIKRNLGPDKFRDFGSALDFSDTEIDVIKYNFDRDGYQEQVHQLIRKWKERFGAPTVHDIAKCLLSIRQIDIIHKLNQL
ncbi:receptor-interacting serine/threonine-protein kinase 1-like [Antedon mediterranea]|uniref:receptor-interacting serine/threonine-protein kinase 1-like n=1 Tax=Antedon mediterranea TaxID=105859 RepID=UPI003AF99AB9